MKPVRAIGTDLFNTLITVEPDTLEDANRRMIRDLGDAGISLEERAFIRSHRDAAMRYLEECKRDGRETHNRFWISAALETQGYALPPDDPAVAGAVEAYFSAFYDKCHLIPGTAEALGILKDRYRLGLLSNFTHAPAARKILDRLGLTPYFDPILISGELGYRKPHPLVFEALIDRMGVDREQILFVGDDPEPDIQGASRAGLQPVWISYVLDRNIPSAAGILGRGTEIPGDSVHRICEWKDLLDLLEGI